MQAFSALRAPASAPGHGGSLLRERFLRSALRRVLLGTGKVYTTHKDRIKPRECGAKVFSKRAKRDIPGRESNPGPPGDSQTRYPLGHGYKGGLLERL